MYWQELSSSSTDIKLAKDRDSKVPFSSTRSRTVVKGAWASITPYALNPVSAVMFMYAVVWIVPEMLVINIDGTSAVRPLLHHI